MKNIVHYLLCSCLAFPLYAGNNNTPRREEELPMQCTMPEEQDLDISLFRYCFGCHCFENPEYTNMFEETAEILNSLPDTCFYIYGHTDDRGKDSYQKKLSEKIAESIAYTFQHRMNVKKEFSIIGLGSEHLLIPDAKNEDDHSLNRRIEIRLTEIE